MSAAHDNGDHPTRGHRMPFRSSEHRGNPTIAVNAALVGYRLVPDMPIGDALSAYALAENMNEYAASARRHPSWKPEKENSLRFQPDHAWTTDQIRFAREVLVRALRAFGRPEQTGVFHQRLDGRYEVADHSDAEAFACLVDDWCILEADHPGDCNEDRDAWSGPDTLYPRAELAHA